MLPAIAPGCDRDKARPRPVSVASTQPPLETIARALGIDAGEIESSADPAAPAGDLKAELEAFTSLDACVQQRARIDPLLGDALEAIGYDTFVRDACRMIEAAQARDGKRCRGIDVSALRSRCQTTVAQIAGSPDACPWDIASRPARGRDPACVAIASRDPRLCAGATDALARATCEAITLHDNAACAQIQSLARARCLRDADRWHSAIPAASAAGQPLTIGGKWRVEAKMDAGGETVVDDMAPELSRGVVLLEERGGLRFVVGPLTEAGPGFIAPSPHVGATFALELFAPLIAASPPSPERGQNVVLERVELLMPGRPPLATPADHSTLSAKLGKFGRARGDAISLVVDGDFSGATSSWHLHAEVSTFVRDVVRASEMFELTSPRLGQDAQMR